MSKSYSVGLVLLSDIPKMGGLCAILQRRGTFNHEKMGPESWPGLCQITAHGKCDSKPLSQNDWLRELGREATEELGEKCAIGLSLFTSPSAKMAEVGSKDTDTKVVRTFGAIVAPEQVSQIALNASTGGLVPVPKSSCDKMIVLDSNVIDRQTGVIERDKIVLFDDELRAVNCAFRRSDILPVLKNPR